MLSLTEEVSSTFFEKCWINVRMSKKHTFNSSRVWWIYYYFNLKWPRKVLFVSVVIEKSFGNETRHITLKSDRLAFRFPFERWNADRGEWRKSTATTVSWRSCLAENIAVMAQWPSDVTNANFVYARCDFIHHDVIVSPGSGDVAPCPVIVFFSCMRQTCVWRSTKKHSVRIAACH